MSLLKSKSRIALILVCISFSWLGNAKRPSCPKILSSFSRTIKAKARSVWSNSFPKRPLEESIPFKDVSDMLADQAHTTVEELRARTNLLGVDSKPIEDLREIESRVSTVVRDHIISINRLEERLEINASKKVYFQGAIKNLHKNFRNWWDQNFTKYSSHRELEAKLASEKTAEHIYREAMIDFLNTAHPSLAEKFSIPASLRRPLEIISTTIKKPISWIWVLLVYSTVLSVGPQIGHKITAPVTAELDRITSDWTSNYQVSFSKMVNTMNLTQHQAGAGETASKMLTILKESSTMKPDDVAKLLADLNDSYASTRVLTPSAVRGDQNEGRNLVHWLGVNYPADTSSRLSFYDDIIQRDKDAILANQVVLDDIRRHHPKVAKALTEEELNTPEEKQYFKTRGEVEFRKKELEEHLIATKKRIAGTLVSWQMVELMFGELFYSDKKSSVSQMYERFQAQYGIIEFLRQNEAEFQEATRDLKLFFQTGKIKEGLFKSLPPAFKQKLVMEDAELRRKGKFSELTLDGDQSNIYENAFRDDLLTRGETSAKVPLNPSSD
jgi:hypothetical protein